MDKKDIYNLNLEYEFKRIFKRFENQLDSRVLDLHSIQLALINLPKMEKVVMPSIFISYFLRPTSAEPQNVFATYTKENCVAILSRTNNYFTENILHLAEEYLIEGLVLLKTIQSQSSLSFPSSSFKEKFNSEINKLRTFGSLEKEIKKLIMKSGADIIPENCPYYTYLKNYVILRNCFTHRDGKITEKEIELEIRLLYISEEQIESAKNNDSINKLNPSTILRKWNLNDKIELTLNEVEGIAYGLIKTLFEIFRHMYKAADKHVEILENIKK